MAAITPPGAFHRAHGALLRPHHHTPPQVYSTRVRENNNLQSELHFTSTH